MTGAASPRFLKDLRLDVPHPASDLLCIELLQAGPRGDLVVGCEDVSIAPLMSQGPLMQWITLKNAARRPGAELCVVLRFASGEHTAVVSSLPHPPIHVCPWPTVRRPVPPEMHRQKSGLRTQGSCHHAQCARAGSRPASPLQAPGADPTPGGNAQGEDLPMQGRLMTQVRPCCSGFAQRVWCVVVQWRLRALCRGSMQPPTPTAAVRRHPREVNAQPCMQLPEPTTHPHCYVQQGGAKPVAPLLLRPQPDAAAAREEVAGPQTPQPPMPGVQRTLSPPPRSAIPPGAAAIEASSPPSRHLQQRRRGSSSRHSSASRHSCTTGGSPSGVGRASAVVPVPLAVASGMLLGAVAYLWSARPVYYELQQGDIMCSIGACVARPPPPAAEPRAGRRRRAAPAMPDLIFPNDRCGPCMCGSSEECRRLSVQ